MGSSVSFSFREMIDFNGLARIFLPTLGVGADRRRTIFAMDFSVWAGLDKGCRL
jgi:hypothetical protein